MLFRSCATADSDRRNCRDNRIGRLRGKQEGKGEGEGRKRMKEKRHYISDSSDGLRSGGRGGGRGAGGVNTGTAFYLFPANSLCLSLSPSQLLPRFLLSSSLWPPSPCFQYYFTPSFSSLAPLPSSPPYSLLSPVPPTTPFLEYWMVSITELRSEEVV